MVIVGPHSNVVGSLEFGDGKNNEVLTADTDDQNLLELFAYVLSNKLRAVIPPDGNNVPARIAYVDGNDEHFPGALIRFLRGYGYGLRA